MTKINVATEKDHAVGELGSECKSIFRPEPSRQQNNAKVKATSKKISDA